MKPIRLFAAFFFVWMTLTAAVAAADITVTKRDVNMAAGLDKNVANILVLLQDGETTDTMMVASINSRTGRSVMMRVDCRLMVDVPEAGETRLADVYALGAQKCRGMLAERTINTLLGLNIGTYVALDVTNLPQLVDAIDTVSMELDEREAAAMGLDLGWNDLTGEEALAYVRLRLEGDDPARSRGYELLMQMLYEGVNSGDLGSMLGLGTKLLGALDTNLNAMTAVTLASAVSAQSARLHTATHLLHAALRRVLGDEVAQKGSNITPERLRFDFSFGRKVTKDELAQVEALVNEWIKADVPVVMTETTVEEAKKEGAIGLFESKYGERVRMYTMGEYSKEICGGPHASHTGELVSFKIQKEESSSAGVRRIKAVIGAKPED